ncbi:MAG: iron ABC transporter substrate-binding protein [Proteobacteria bacterium]|nr:iron ABC transporter substrate-binding protein [Pseudomonadota bacterium]MBU2226163.1 iron ABC transporter substrate-binding protein [Pseudomonadota bacterium]MBU2260519.1 iron ABC transporter substrate-binding protein [Pseudomonadota bacterium]
MNNIKNIIVLALILVLACFGPLAAEGAEKMRITDAAGRQVEAPLNPKRLLAIGPGSLRMICYLEGTDRVVGVEAFEKSQPVGRPYILANPELNKLSPIGPGGPASINREPDLEAVLRVSPEVIFVVSMEAAKAEALQKKLGIPVVILSYGSAGAGTFDEMAYESLRVTGRILGKENRAEGVIAFIEKARRELLGRTEKVKEDRKPRVYAGGISLRGMQGLDSSDADYPPLAWVNARNLAREAAHKGHIFVDKEKLLSWNPDLIFVDAWGLNLIMQDYQRKPDFYRNLKAVREKRIHMLYPFNMYSTNIDTVVADAYAVGKILYPDIFTDIDIAERAGAVYSFLLRRSVYGELKKQFGDLGRVVDISIPVQTP